VRGWAEVWASAAPLTCFYRTPTSAEPEYWNERYEHDVDPFDWLFQFSHFVDAGYMKHIPMEATVLMLGCGNADFSAEMYDHGVKNITNIDLSTVVVEQMRKRNIHRLGMSYHVMDVQELAFPNALFDVVVDKSTMDCIFCCDGSVRIVGRMLTEAYRVLKPGGMYISMSLHTPEKVWELHALLKCQRNDPLSLPHLSGFAIPLPTSSCSLESRVGSNWYVTRLVTGFQLGLIVWCTQPTHGTLQRVGDRSSTTFSCARSL